RPREKSWQTEILPSSATLTSRHTRAGNFVLSWTCGLLARRNISGKTANPSCSSVVRGLHELSGSEFRAKFREVISCLWSILKVRPSQHRWRYAMALNHLPTLVLRVASSDHVAGLRKNPAAMDTMPATLSLPGRFMPGYGTRSVPSGSDCVRQAVAEPRQA